VRRLSCKLPKGKPPRYAPEPEDAYMRVSPSDGGIVASERPADTSGRPDAIARKRDLILAVLPQGSVREIADATGIPKSTVGDLLQRMAECGDVARVGDRWVSGCPEVSGGQSRTAGQGVSGPAGGVGADPDRTPDRAPQPTLTSPDGPAPRNAIHGPEDDR
jgi:hypothetical protein